MFFLGLIIGIVLSIPVYNLCRPVSIYDVPECKNFIGHNPNLQLLSEPVGKNKTFVFFTSTMNQDEKFYVFIGDKEGMFKNQTVVHYSYPVDAEMLMHPENNIPNKIPVQWTNAKGKQSDLVYYGIVPQNVQSVKIDGVDANIKEFNFTYLDNKDNNKNYDVKIKFYYLVVEDTNGEEPNTANIELVIA